MSLKISRVLHAGYVFETHHTKILFDAIFENPFSQNCFAYPNVAFDAGAIRELKFDAAFISHYHEDHCSLASLDLLNRETPIYLYCVHERLFELIRALGFARVFSLELNERYDVGELAVTPLLTLDPDIDAIFQIEGGGVRVLNVVDAWLDPSTVEALTNAPPIDVVLWPFQTLREVEVLTPSRYAPSDQQVPHEWIEQLKRLNPRYVVPSSCQFTHEEWSWLNRALFPISYDAFSNQVREALPSVQVVRLNPSVSIELDNTTLRQLPALSWVELIGLQDLDYDYEPGLTAPTTSEIAQHLSPLTCEQSDRILRYCRTEILARFRERYRESRFFDVARNWRLILRSHNGEATQFDYIVTNGTLQLSRFDFNDVSWLTELPAVKLYSALESGESLTSMYVRINDSRLNAAAELALDNFDVFDDPLIQSLFNGEIVPYQEAQLKSNFKLN